MFAISVRVSPWSARSSPRSVGRSTTSSPSLCSTFIRTGTACTSSPSGPMTCTRPGASETLTLSGTRMGCRPIRLMTRLPDERDHFAADTALGGGALRDQPIRRGQDGGAHAAEDARQALLLRVDAAAGLGDPLEVADDPLAVLAVLQVDDEGVEGFAAPHLEVADIALLLEDPGDLDLHLRGRHLGALVQRLVGVADACQHVCDRIGQHRSLLTTSSWSCRG